MESGDQDAHDHGSVLPEAQSSEVARLERERIDAVYAGYRTSGRSESRWDGNAPGNRTIMRERRQEVARRLTGVGVGSRILEVGCGAGGVLAELRSLCPAGVHFTGVDLLGDRLAKGDDTQVSVAQADGVALPFRSDAFGVVAVFTMFSSILDTEVRKQVAREIERVLAPDGWVLWYDMRYPSPSNRSVRPLTRSAIKTLFPGWLVDGRSVSVLPPLARALGRHDSRWYPRAARFPPLRSHLIATIRPPELQSGQGVRERSPSDSGGAVADRH